MWLPFTIAHWQYNHITILSLNVDKIICINRIGAWKVWHECKYVLVHWLVIGERKNITPLNKEVYLMCMLVKWWGKELASIKKGFANWLVFKHQLQFGGSPNLTMFALQKSYFMSI